MGDDTVRTGYKDSRETLDKGRILREIASILAPPTKTEDEFTALDFADETGLTKKKAYSILMKAADNGLLSRRKVVENRNKPWAFKPIGDLAETLREILK